MDNVDEIVQRAVLRREMFHPLLQASVCDNFVTGNYDIAVRLAFAIVEAKVKSAPGNKDDVGVKLMRAAFNANGGPQTLTDMSLMTQVW